MSTSVEKAVVSTVLLAVIIPVFFGAGAVTPNHISAARLATPLDAFIPLFPAAVWVYLSWYIAPWLLLAAQRHHFRRLAAALVLAFFTCTVFYIVLPLSMDRPQIVSKSLSERMLSLLYQNDPPWNIFPSFHAALCALMWRPVFGGSFTRAVMRVWMILICAACVLTKQHQIIDVAAGLLLGFGMLSIVTALFEHFEHKRKAILVTQ